MAALPSTFPDAQSAVDALLRDGNPADAERLVARLREKARSTHSRELDALAWFAKGALEAGHRDFPAAEQSLLVAVNIGRDLFKELSDALGHAARSLGFVYARLNRPDAAAEMFLLARNVFLKTQPQLAPEVVRFAASCNIALQLPEVALAIVHQELGPPEERSTPGTADGIDLYLLRARAFEEQHRPAQALKALARATQLLTDDAHARTVVAQAWIEVAHVWGRAGDPSAAAHALGCALILDGERHGSSSRHAIEDARTELGLRGRALHAELTWQAQRVVDTAVAYASPARGLFFTRAAHVEPQQLLGAEQLPDGTWALRRPLKLIHGALEPLTSQNMARTMEKILGRTEGAPFQEGDVLHLDTGLNAPVVRAVTIARPSKVLYRREDQPSSWNALAGTVAPGRSRTTGTVWEPGHAAVPTTADDVVQELLRRTDGG